MKQLKLFFAFKVDEGCLSGTPTDPRFGVVERDGRRIFRFRSDDDDYRIYFTVEQNEDGDNVVVVQRVLHADSLKDFFFRSGTHDNAYIIVLTKCLFMIVVTALYSRIYTLMRHQQTIVVENERLKTENLSSEGTYAGAKASKKMTIELNGITARPAKVTINGKKASVKYNAKNSTATITFNWNIANEATIVVNK